jgi:hypothetical protein
MLLLWRWIGVRLACSTVSLTPFIPISKAVPEVCVLVLRDRKTIRHIADEFGEVYERRPQLEHLDSSDDLYTHMKGGI